MSKLAGRLLTVLLAAGCSPVDQPANIKEVAAIEVPMRTPADRADLLQILRKDAAASGADMVDNSAGWQQFETQAQRDGVKPDPDGVVNKTFYAGLFEDHSDNDPLADLDDGGHQGRPWLTFFRGRHPETASTFRTHMIADIRRRWPDARVIPIMPNGSLPLDADLVWTGQAYVVRPDRVAAYAATANQPSPAR